MGANDRTDHFLAMNGIARHRLWRLLVLAGLALLATICGAWLLHSWHDDDLENRFSAGVLADYVPEDSEAVLAVNVRQALETQIGRQYFGSVLQQLIEQAEPQSASLELAGIKRVGDIDTLFISFAPGVGAEPLWLVRGQFDRSHFQVGPDKLQEKTLDSFRVWECRDHSAKRTALLAPISDMLIVSETPDRIQAALKQARDPRPVQVRDARLRDLLSKVDRRQSLWLAASIRSLGVVSSIDNYLLKLILRPLLTHADSVYGGIACGEDVQVELHISAATDTDAAQLETDLRSLREAAPGAALLIRQSQLKPILRLLSSAQIHRDGKSILLRSQLAADQEEE